MNETSLTHKTITIEEIHKEIDLLQSCISRMAQNSFAIKGWAYVLVAAIAALSAEKLNLYALCIGGIFIFCIFWWLDAFFLKMEKLYRYKYEWVIVMRPNGNRSFLYDLNPTNKETWMAGKKDISVTSVMFSKPHTLLIFYGSPILIGIVVIILKVTGCLKT